MEFRASEAFVRGLTGKEEPASKARLVVSPEPLPNEMKKIRKMYWVCLAVCCMGIFNVGLFAIGILMYMVTTAVIEAVLDHKRQRLRRAKFRFRDDVTNDELFLKMQPVFSSKYDMLVEKRDDGILMLNYAGYTYDVFIGNDATFTIWWRKTSAVPVTFGKYRTYRKFLAAMGIIAYEIQRAYEIQTLQP